MSKGGFYDIGKDKTYKSEYKYVYRYVSRKDGSVMWQGQFYHNQTKSGKFYETEKEAAKAVDLFLIGKGKEPINILKRK
tara:strand:- start:2738 stop:2974 length:237 start_codon:yes stop_codon:yes gene_type:complete